MFFLTQDGLFEGQIDNIQDIEENIWIPQMGLKGKVDASVNVRVGSDKGKVLDQNTLQFVHQFECNLI